MRDTQVNELPVWRPVPSWAIAVLALISAWFVVPHLIHVFTEAINWDEFALLERADRTVRLDQVVGGGRPGLVTLILIPFVRDCVDSVLAVVNARLLWLVPTFGYLVGVYVLVRRWHTHSLRTRDGHPEALLAVALLAFMPAFISWSVQVRTDQMALAFSIWGGCLLLTTGYASAIAAGALFALSFLCTQKAVYTIALALLLYSTAVASRLAHGGTSIRGEASSAFKRLLVAMVAALLVIAIYVAAFPEAARLASSDSIGSSLKGMEWIRAQQGYRVYTVHASRLVVHWALFFMLVSWSFVALYRRQRDKYITVATCWLVLGLGAVIIRFHGSSFPYFIMTAGLFPAIALSLSAPAQLLRAGKLAWPTLVALIALAALQSSRETLEMLAENSQAKQREVLQLVRQSPLVDRRGYQVEGALFCMRDPSPIPPMFSEGIARRFFLSADSAQNTSRFIDEFRDRPVAYIVESFRLLRFPQSVKAFFSEHYVSYDKSLYVAGFWLDFHTAGTRAVDVIVPATYRWEPDSRAGTPSIVIDGRVLNALDEIELQLGKHEISAASVPTVGRLILADLPAVAERSGAQPFYSERQYLQLRGLR